MHAYGSARACTPGSLCMRVAIHQSPQHCLRSPVHRNASQEVTESYVDATAQKAQGSCGRKRTPTSAFDGMADKDVYEPADGQGRRHPRQFNIKWAEFEDKHNTTLEHSLFAAFNTD